MSSPPGLWFRRVAVAAHLSLIVRCGSSWQAGCCSSCGQLALLAPGTARQLPAAAAQPAAQQPPLSGAHLPTACPASRPPASPHCRREVWRNLFAPGTFRAVLRALWRTLTTGERFSWPQPAAAAAAAPGPLVPADAGGQDSWYVGAADLAQFKWTIEEDGRPAGASDWEPMMEKQWPG